MQTWRLPDKLRRKYETAEALGLTEKTPQRRLGWSVREGSGQNRRYDARKKQIIRQENECIQDLRKFTTR